jgi:type VI secretion system protein VasI
VKKAPGIITLAILLGSLLLACEQSGKPDSDYKPRWQSSVSTDPANGSSSVQMMVAAVDRSPSQQYPVTLILSCQDRNTDVYVIWRQYMGTYDVELSWKVGSDETVKETWSLSTDNEATFAPEPILLINRMMGSEVFQIKAAPFGSSPVTHVFDTSGLMAEVTPLREACGW